MELIPYFLSGYDSDRRPELSAASAIKTSVENDGDVERSLGSNHFEESH